MPRVVAPIIAFLVCLSGCRAFYDFDDIREGGGDIVVRAPHIFGVEGLPEGLGYVLESAECDISDEACALEPTVAREYPVFIGNLQAGDDIEIELPMFGEHDWTLCGQAIAPGTTLAFSMLAAPCVQGDQAAAFTIAVPLDRREGQSPTARNVYVRITRDSSTIEESIRTVALDEGYSVSGKPPLPVTQPVPFSFIYIVDLYQPAWESDAIDWMVVSSALLRRRIRANGEGGGTRVGAPFEGGRGGVGSDSNGTDIEVPNLDDPRHGDDGEACTSSCAEPTTALSGAGGGHFSSGAAGDGNGSCKGMLSTPGARSTPDPFLLDLRAAYGAGGGYGGTLTCTGACAGPYAGGAGGGGGGVFALQALGHVELYRDGLSPLIAADGGDGGMPEVCGMDDGIFAGPGGGGSGGAISITASTVTAPGALGELDALLDVSGGEVVAPGGAGSRGHIRLDATGEAVEALDTTPHDIVRGPDLPIIANGPIIRLPSIDATLILNDADGVAKLGLRTMDSDSSDDEYSLSELSPDSSPSLAIGPGLHEVCVVLGVAAVNSAKEADLPHRARRCTWIAYVP